MVLAKYDIRGIQAYIFRTNRLREIDGASQLPEKIIKEAAEKASKITKVPETTNASDTKETWPVWLDQNGGNGLAVFPDEKFFINFSRCMAEYILRETYSLRLAYACVECTDSFAGDFARLNEKLGRLKSSMPEACHTGALPICRIDSTTGLPISSKRYVKEERRYEFLSEESVIKNKWRGEKIRSGETTQGDQIDRYIEDKGESSYIAIIHIDGNSMGDRITEIINNFHHSEYSCSEGLVKLAELFSRIKVKDRFAEVCREVSSVVEAYTAERSITRPLVRTFIQAGDDITYITRASIALPLTELFLTLAARKFMFEPEGNDPEPEKKYAISSCAGIAFAKSHFPFSDAYQLAESCCSSAKRRGKLEENRGENGCVGSWIDFAKCGHIKDIDLDASRKRTGIVDRDTTNELSLIMRPYCLASELCHKDDYDYHKFKARLLALLSESESSLDRSRAKALRAAYEKGESCVVAFGSAAESRGRSIGNDEYIIDIGGRNYASCYDPIEVMDMYDKDFQIYVDSYLNNNAEGETEDAILQNQTAE